VLPAPTSVLEPPVVPELALLELALEPLLELLLEPQAAITSVEATAMATALMRLILTLSPSIFRGLEILKPVRATTVNEVNLQRYGMLIYTVSRCSPMPHPSKPLMFLVTPW
jgi:hypothetical protein